MTVVEPEVRGDGRCACGCGKKRVLRVPRKSALRGQARENLEAQMAADPFFSARCCRGWYGVDVGEQPLKDNGSGQDRVWDDVVSAGSSSLFSLPRRAR